MKRLHKIVAAYSIRMRSQRALLFRSRLRPSVHDRILDLGGGTGVHLANIVPFRRRVVLADINPHLLRQGRRRYGFHTTLLDVSQPLPFPNQHFDIVFCSSLIEHATGDKKQALRIRSNRAFARVAFAKQRVLADEIRRISKSYYVQTPYKYFPIESHTWLPFLLLVLPRWFQIEIIAFLNDWWPKKTYPDWHLLTVREIRELFPDAEIVRETSWGFTKSLIAIRSRTWDNATTAPAA